MRTLFEHISIVEEESALNAELIESIKAAHGLLTDDCVASMFAEMEFVDEPEALNELRYSSNPDIKQGNTNRAETIFKRSDEYRETKKKYAINGNHLKAFFAVKRPNPYAVFGNKDYAYQEGPLKGIMHCALSRGIRLLYKIGGTKEQPVINLCLIATHDDTGTGTPAKIEKQKSVAKRIANMTFETAQKSA
jgi:hypothetical protein